MYSWLHRPNFPLNSEPAYTGFHPLRFTLLRPSRYLRAYEPS